MNIRRFTQALVSIAALATSACAITSDSLELRREDEGGQALVTADWQGGDEVSGAMTASFPDGRLFRGTYFTITQEVFASLSATNGEHLRCRFEMSHPSTGLIGGAKGKCQLADGSTVSARIPRTQPFTESVAGRH